MRRNVFFLYALLCIAGVNCSEKQVNKDIISENLFNYPNEQNNTTGSDVKQTGDPDKNQKFIDRGSNDLTDPNVAECITENGEPGVCVMYYLCEHGTNKIIEDGHTLIYKRSIEQCPRALDICCHQEVLHSSPFRFGEVALGVAPSATSPKRNPSVNKDDNTTNNDDLSSWVASTEKITESSSPGIIGNYGFSNPGAHILSLGEGLSSNERVYADFGEFPWMVALLKHSEDEDWKTSNYIGGGSLIHPLVVMTVAHILENLKANQINVRVGEYDTNSEDELYKHQERNVAKIVVHPNYVRRYLYNDIGLLFLDAPVILKDAPHIGIGSLAALQPLPDTVCFSIGWGAGNFANKTVFASILQKVKLTIKEKNKCEEDLRKTHFGRLFGLHESLFCASGEEGIDTCRGDEGSSFICPLDEKMLSNVLFLMLLGLCCGQLKQNDADDDLSKLLQEIFGPVSSTASSVTKEVNSSCITSAGVNGKCVTSSSCISGRAQENVNYKGKCENSNDICCPSNDIRQKCGVGNLQMDSTRILNTDTTSFAEYPWVVAVLHLVPTNQSGGGKMAIFACGGSLIHPRVVMTTAHNVQKLSNLRVRAGEWDTTSTDEVLPHQERDVDRIIVHEAYNSNRSNLHNDIALLVVDKPFDFKPNVNTVCLPSDTRPPAPATRCISSGWGKNNFGKKGSYQTIPKKVELPVVDHSDCQSELRKTRLGQFFKLHKSFLCAGGQKGLDTCTGDGGSPLMCPVPGEDGRFVANGMVAWGIGCGDAYPSVYVDVAYLKPWVDEKMADLGYPTSFYTI